MPPEQNPNTFFGNMGGNERFRAPPEPEVANSNVEEVGMQDADVRIGRIENEVVPVYNPGLGAEMNNTNSSERSLPRNVYGSLQENDYSIINTEANTSARRQRANQNQESFQSIQRQEEALRNATDAQRGQRRIEQSQERISTSEATAYDELANVVLARNATPEERAAFKTKLVNVLNELARDLQWDLSQGQPIELLFIELNKRPPAIPDPRILSYLSDNETGFGTENARKIITCIQNSDTILATINSIQAERPYLLAAQEDLRDGTVRGGRFDRLIAANRQATNAEEAQQNVEQVTQEFAQTSVTFRKFIQQRDQVNEVIVRIETQRIELQMQQAEQARAAEAARRAPALRVAAAVQLLEFGVSPDTLASLPPQGQAAVQSVVENGGARMMGALLSNGVSSDEGFVGNVAGQYVSLDYAEGELYLIGENAGDRANQLFYRIDPPTPAGFETVLIHSVGEQNRMPFIANHGPQAEMIWERLVGNPKDDGFPEEGNIDRFRNFLVLLIGEGSPDEAEEEARLRQLGIITRDAQTINRERVDLFVRALEKYVPSGLVLHEGDSPTTVSPESPSFNFQDALTLATLWDADNRRLPEDLNELKKLTEMRQGGEDITSRRFV